MGTKRQVRFMAADDLPGDVAVPPGRLLIDELGARGITQKDLAAKMGRPIQTINAIARGKKTITAETALGLEEALGVSAALWLNLETQYQLALARARKRASAA